MASRFLQVSKYTTSLRATKARLATSGLLIVLFAISCLGYHQSGVRFDDSTLGYYWQFLDPLLLRHRLAESLFYLHSQPPLFNLFLGVMLKLFPGAVSPAFHFVYLLLGMALYATVFGLMRRLGVSRATALMVSTWFMVSPSFALYQHFLFYTMPVAALLAASALLYYEVLEKQRPTVALLFFGVLFMLCSLRATYHLLYYLLLTGAVLVPCVRRRKMIALAALVPLVLLSALYVKNLVVLGFFGTSSWMGMNLASHTMQRLPMGERRRMASRGELSEVTLAPRFHPVDSYPEKYRHTDGFPDVPALREAKKSTGADNYNHLAYISISQDYLKDHLYIIRHRPRVFFGSLACAWACYSQPSSSLPVLSSNRRHMVLMEHLYDRIFYGVTPSRAWLALQSKVTPAHWRRHHPLRGLFSCLTIGLPLLVISALLLTADRRRAAAGLGRSQRALLLFLCFNIIYTAVIGNLSECGENYRFRFESDPLYVVLLGVMVQYWVLPPLHAALRKLTRSLPGRKR